MTSDKYFNKYIDRVVHIRTANNLYVKIDNITETNRNISLILVNNKLNATEFILQQKTDTNFCFRVNIDCKNQNNEYGYYIYTIPENDLIYGCGNDGLYAQFQLERNNEYIKIKSAFKNCYLCYDYNILRIPNKGNSCNFSFDDNNIITSTQITNTKTICIISYGFLRQIPNIDTAPLLNTLKELYPTSSIDIYMHLPNIMDEFYDVEYDPNMLISTKFNLSIKNYKYDVNHFMQVAHSFGLPIINGKHKNYMYRILSMLWNISESIKYLQSSKKYYDVYILLRNDSYSQCQIIRRLINPTKFYCLQDKENVIDSHMMIGKEILNLASLYDFFVKNKNQLSSLTPCQIITNFFMAYHVDMSPLCYITPKITYSVNSKKTEDTFYKMIYAKYQEIIHCY